MSDKRKFCIFCGGSGLTKEHVWPRWTHKHVVQPKFTNNDYVQTRKLSFGGIDALAYKEKRRQGNALNAQVRVVCLSCNGGWMKQLEESNKEIVEKLVKGQDCLLDANEQMLLTRWFLKSYCALEARYRNPNDHVSTSQERLMLKEGKIPPNWNVWFGASTSMKWAASYGHNAHRLLMLFPGEASESRQKNTVIFTFGIEHLFFHLRICPLNKYLHPSSRFPGIARLWPPRGKNIHWPPGPRMDDDEIDALHYEVDNAIALLPRMP